MCITLVFYIIDMFICVSSIAVCIYISNYIYVSVAIGEYHISNPPQEGG